MKTKIKKPVAKKKPAAPAWKIPVALKRRVVKSFKSKDRSRSLFVLQHDTDHGWSVQSVSKGLVTPVRVFANPSNGGSEIPLSIHQIVNRELAVWYARFVAKHNGELPSVRKERSYRKRFTKKTVAKHQSHMETKAVVRAVRQEIRPPAPPEKPVLRSFVFIYDPQQTLGTLDMKAFFRVHECSCSNLDHDRAKAVRKGGESWVVEGYSAKAVVEEQLREFDEAQKGYDMSDFVVHSCRLAPIGGK